MMCHVQEMKEYREAEGKMEETPTPGVSPELEPPPLPEGSPQAAALLSPHRDSRRHRGPSHHRPLARTQSSPLVTFSVPDNGPVTYTFTTG